jgi:hypothetical protein
MVSLYTNIFNDVPNIIYFEWLPHTYQPPNLVVKTLAIKRAKKVELLTPLPYTLNYIYVSRSSLTLVYGSVKCGSSGLETWPH